MRIRSVALIVVLAVLIAWTPSWAGWKIPFDGSASQPVVQDGVVFIGSLDGAVYALDAATGRQKWRYQTGEGLTSGSEPILAESRKVSDQIGAALKALEEPPRGARTVNATPVVRDGIVYIGSGDHFFYALDATTGELIWRTDLGCSISEEALVVGQAIIVDGDAVILRLDLSDGAVRWSTAGMGWITSFALGDSLVYFASEDKESYSDKNEDEVFSVIALDLENGDQRWAIQLKGRRPECPVFSDDTLFVSAYEGGQLVKSAEGSVRSAPTITHVYAIDGLEGNLLWDFRAGEICVGGAPPLTVGCGHLYLVTEEGLSAVRKVSGELDWFLEGCFQARNVQLSDKLYVDSGLRARRESILALDPETGAIVWRSSPGKNIYLEDVIDDAAYVSAGTSLVALRTSDGKKLWRRRTGGMFGGGTTIATPPTKSGRMLFFPTETNVIWGKGTIQGRLFGINAETGKLK